MDWLSVVILVFVGLMGVLGLRQGFVRQILGLAGLVAAVVLAFSYYDRAGDLILGYLDITREMANVMGFVAVCAGVAIVVWIAEWTWGRLVRYTPVSFVDAVGGGLFGLIKGAVIAAIVLLVLQALPFEGVRDALATSPVARGLLDVSPKVYARIEDVLPAGVPGLMDRDRGAGAGTREAPRSGGAAVGGDRA